VRNFEELDDIKNFVEYILYTSKAKQKKPISIRGIWKNKGFENLDIEKELKTIRSELQSNLDRKKFY
jgi:hypothetical protein